MLLSLRKSIRSDMSSMLAKYDNTLQEHKDRLSHMENKLQEFSEAHNKIVDVHTAHRNYIDWIKAKMADLEERSRQ